MASYYIEPGQSLWIYQREIFYGTNSVRSINQLQDIIGSDIIMIKSEMTKNSN